VADPDVEPVERSIDAPRATRNDVDEALEDRRVGGGEAPTPSAARDPQYFGFALNLAQQIAFLFGEDELFDGDAELSEAAQMRVIAYLGAMFGAAGTAALIAQTSHVVGQNIGRKVAAQALTKTAWYPLVKRVGALVGQKITKKTVEKAITKTVPVVGGFVSGGLTYVAFRPMGGRLADALVANLNGEFDDSLELNPEFAATLRGDAHDEAPTDVTATLVEVVETGEGQVR
jgi:hypothetical protein